jgi:cellulose synthase/poly-beta-1,6-N-acetylglucosamine synthase-like glycosyltransferase
MKICSGTLVDYYRRNRLSETPIEIQVLDDSTDDSVVETEALIHKIAQVGLDIKHIRRSNRTGYAGALKEGLLSAKGEFIAIFDADFVPKDWLYKTIPYFKDPKLGCSNPLGT